MLRCLFPATGVDWWGYIWGVGSAWRKFRVYDVSSTRWGQSMERGELTLAEIFTQISTPLSESSESTSIGSCSTIGVSEEVELSILSDDFAMAANGYGKADFLTSAASLARRDS